MEGESKPFERKSSEKCEEKNPGEFTGLDALSSFPSSSVAFESNKENTNFQGNHGGDPRKPFHSMEYPQAPLPRIPIYPPPTSAPPPSPPSYETMKSRRSLLTGGGISQVFNWGISAKFQRNLYDTDEEDNDDNSVSSYRRQIYEHRTLPTSNRIIGYDRPPSARSSSGGSSSSNHSKHSIDSNQQQKRGFRANIPTIENYGDSDHGEQPPIIIPLSPSSSDTASMRISRGLFDANLRPNRGEINSSSGATLKETIFRMRFVNLSLCALVVVTEVLSWIGHILFLQASTLVLSVFLAFFAAMLCVYELHWSVFTRFIRSNFGLLYNPNGRALWLGIMGSMLLGRNAGLWDLLLGPIFLVNSICTLIVPCRYPDYERAFEKEGMEDLLTQAVVNEVERTQFSWANPNGDGVARFANVVATSGERQGLLSQV